MSVIQSDVKSILSKVDLSPLEGKSVVVAGASGLIGTYITAALSTWGGCRHLFTTSRSRISSSSAVYPYLSGAIHSEIELAAQNRFALPPCDFAVFAAGYGQPAKFTSNGMNTLLLNTIGVYNTLTSLNEGGRALYLSSSEIYSGNTKPPFRETDVGMTTPQHPRGCYIEAKRCGEAICSAYNSSYTRNQAVVARVALAYGPGTAKDDDRVLNQFIKSAITTGKITLRDNGQAIRTYSYVADTVEVLLNALLRGSSDVYNVGGKSKTTIANLARKIGELTGAQVDVPSTGSSGESPSVVNIDTGKIEHEFCKKDWVSLDEGLLRTIDYQRKLYAMV